MKLVVASTFAEQGYIRSQFVFFFSIYVEIFRSMFGVFEIQSNVVELFRRKRIRIRIRADQPSDSL